MVVFNSQAAALLICHLASVCALSVPSHQEMTGSDVSTSSNLLPASPSNLTLPPTVSGFEARLLFDRTPTLPLFPVYDIILRLLYTLAVEPWDETIVKGAIVTTRQPEQIIIKPWPSASPSRLLIKHGVVALFEAGSALAAQPVTRRGYVPRLYAGLFLQDRQVGYLKWFDDTVGLGNASDSTGTLQLLRRDRPTGVGDCSGTIVDPGDSRFKVMWRLGDRAVGVPDIFSAFLEAMATAAPNDASAFGAHVNAVGVSADVALSVYGTAYSSKLRWKALTTSLALIWSRVIAQRQSNREFDFELYYDEEIVGRGFLLNVTGS